MKIANGHRKVTLKEAASLLQELGICKAFSASNKINGPNCYRFGHRDSATGQWSWEVGELIDIARKKKSASISLINEVIQRYRLEQVIFPDTSDLNIGQLSGRSFPPSTLSRAELEKTFRDAVRTLEGLMKLKLPADGAQEDRRMLGDLIATFERNGLFQKVETSEARFVNNIRNALNHPNLGEVSDDQLLRGIESVRALIRFLKGPQGADK
jgi:hypothetical protein